MKSLECLIFKKIRKMMKNKRNRIRDFENLLLEEEFINMIYAIDQQEEDVRDVLIFSSQDEFRSYEASIFKEIQELDESKSQLLNNYESKILEYEGLTNEEALAELDDWIEWSEIYANRYFNDLKSTIQRLVKKLTVIKHIQLVQNQIKRIDFNYRNIQRNLNNLQNIISVDNAKEILIKNIKKLGSTLEEKFQNFQKLINQLRDEPIIMNPCQSEEYVSKCPSISDSSSNSDDELYVDVVPEEEEVQKKTSECFFVDPSSVKTKMGSIENLKTNAVQLDEKIESIQEEKSRIFKKIQEKKDEILEALAKVAELEDIIREVEALIADKLYTFQQRVIALESKLIDNFKTENDVDVKNLLENELFELKETFQVQSSIDEKERNDLIKQGQIFAASIGDILPYVHKFYDSTKHDENFSLNIEKLKHLLQRPPQFCHDSKGRRFYLNKQGIKIYQDEHYTPHYVLDPEGEATIINEGFKIESNDNGEFYTDLKGRQIYVKYYFEDDLGRYYMDVHGDRHYKADSEASEYMLVNGVWVKTKEGTYERDDKGMRIRPADSNQTDQEVSTEALDDSQTDSKLQTVQKEKISSEDMKYIKETVGPAIVKACAATYLHKPSDPLSYFANFLLHYRYTQKMFEARERELNYFIELRKKMEEMKEQQQIQ